MIEEIERKYLPATDKWRESIEKTHKIWQGLEKKLQKIQVIIIQN